LTGREFEDLGDALVGPIIEDLVAFNKFLSGYRSQTRNEKWEEEEEEEEEEEKKANERKWREREREN